MLKKKFNWLLQEIKNHFINKFPIISKALEYEVPNS